MTGAPYSLILLPTLECDAACDYCFEHKSRAHLSHDQLALIITKIFDFMDQERRDLLRIYWQGGEVMTLAPEWLERASEIINDLVVTRNKPVINYLQSNLLAYDSTWNKLIREMFDNSVGTSFDFPNLHRKLKGGDAAAYTTIWRQKVRLSQEAGIHLGVIAIPNAETLRLGARCFYSYFVDELGLADLQINTPFPGGHRNDVKRSYPLPTEPLSRFYRELVEVWAERAPHDGVRIHPLDQLSEYFTHGAAELPCTWGRNCTEDFICVDPRGYVAQCDCWVTSYPDYRFGNLLGPDSLADLLQSSPARRALHSRPSRLIRHEDCINCPYLALCHGGCPIRAYTVHGDLDVRDPYCEAYKVLFKAVQEV